MIASDLNSAGFCTVTTTHYVVARLHRPIDIDEVETALHNHGYDECQFSTQKVGSGVAVTAITGDE
jgi:hypothetical protein